jgi:hypothetical protein
MKEYTIKVREDMSAFFEQLIDSLDFAEVDSNDWWNTISEKSKDQILQSQHELRAGKGISHAEVRKEMDQLLGKS